MHTNYHFILLKPLYSLKMACRGFLLFISTITNRNRNIFILKMNKII